MRFVFDTNTLISAILKPKGTTMQIVTAALQKGTIVCSTETKTEIRNVIQRDKFNKYLPLDERLKTLENILDKAIHVETKTTDLITSRDFTDVKFLRLAFEVKADCLISGDADLKVLNPFRGIPILSISEFSSFITTL
ncbi:MAG: putative toxin-antitoxin system toxin component, PIN family [Cyclobacteriaceae bacterium]